MILTTHILSGALLGTKIRNPYEVAGLAIVLHFLLDLLPHGDYLNKKSSLRDFWKVAIDLAIGFSLVAIILLHRNNSQAEMLMRNTIVGIFFSILPDGLTFLYWKMGMKFLEPIYRFHQKLHLAPDFSPQRQFRIKNNLGDILISTTSFLILLSLL